MDLRPGDVVFGPDPSAVYSIEGFLGQGGFGLVYRIRGESDQRIYALKTIATASLDTPGLQALVNEGRLAAEVKHPNVIEYIFFHDGEQYQNLPPYIIMEYAEGGDLEQVIHNRQDTGEFFTVEELKAMLLQLALGMQAVNQQLIHRDVRPSNILLAQDKLKISDFGLSKVVGQATRTRTFKGVQHVAYMAPEAWALETNTIQMDIYSMGVVFYELATLAHPYSLTHTGDQIEAWKQAHLFQVAKLPETINPSIELPLSQAIMKMIAKRPQARYDDWDQIIRRIQSSDEGAKDRGIARVEQLIKKAIEAEHRRAMELAVVTEKQRQRADRIAVVAFQAQQLLNQVEEIVGEFNKGFDGPSLNLEVVSEAFSGPKPFFIIGGQGGTVRIFLNAVTGSLIEQMKLEGKPVFAWGWAITPQGRGFNLLLVPDTPEDLYGSWLSLRNTHSAAMRKSDNRPDPFPFSTPEELAEQLALLRAMHIYTSQQASFSTDHLVALLEEIV